MKKITEQDFFKACKINDINVVKSFVTNNKELIDVETKQGWTGLVISCFNQNLEITKFLIENGADLNHSNSKGTTVLMYAKTPVLENQRNTTLLQYLLDKGANINARDKFFKTVLDYVIEKERFVLADWLASRGAKKSISLSNG